MTTYTCVTLVTYNHTSTQHTNTPNMQYIEQPPRTLHSIRRTLSGCFTIRATSRKKADHFLFVWRWPFLLLLLLRQAYSFQFVHIHHRIHFLCLCHHRPSCPEFSAFQYVATVAFNIFTKQKVNSLLYTAFYIIQLYLEITKRKHRKNKTYLLAKYVCCVNAQIFVAISYLVLQRRGSNTARRQNLHAKKSA